jgi:hypothetical protein
VEGFYAAFGASFTSFVSVGFPFLAAKRHKMWGEGLSRSAVILTSLNSQPRKGAWPRGVALCGLSYRLGMKAEENAKDAEDPTAKKEIWRMTRFESSTNQTKTQQ